MKAALIRKQEEVLIGKYGLAGSQLFHEVILVS